MVKPLQSRFGGLYLWAVVMLFVDFLLRTSLLVRCHAEIDWRPASLAQVYLVGVLFDLVTYFYLVLPVALYVLFAPDRIFRSRFNRLFSLVNYAVAVFALLFAAVAEWFFWDEFGHRFNFIAVDYLVYTQEVVGNIAESYPLKAAIGILLALTALVVLLTRKQALLCHESQSSLVQRLKPGSVFLIAPVLAFFFVEGDLAERSGNTYVNELSKNGMYSFAMAFTENRLDYEKFYLVQERDRTFARVRNLLQAHDSRYVSQNSADLTRQVQEPGPQARKNVVLIVVESLSADFLGVFGNREGLTPNLDALAHDGLLLTDLYATGTRTVRGLEAIALSVPPTPGCSAVKRPDQGPVFSLPGIFRQAGYDTVFLYGGFGYFDNMNAFFSANGCRIVDRRDLAKEEITFANIWGVCDGDLLGRTLREADAAFSRGVPFFHLVMTVSNHRPYTYPHTVDIPSGTGRAGAVKYTDYALGEFFRHARRKPWFDDTVFVVIADHCASSAGKVDVPARRYHIPMIVYAPKLVRPGRCDALCSQIDVGPTLLGLLDFSYTSKFFGADVLEDPPHRAFLATYEKLGLLTDQTLTILDVKRKCEAYHIAGSGAQTPVPVDRKQLLDAISYYQSASYLLDRHLY